MQKECLVDGSYPPYQNTELLVIAI